MKGVFVKKEEAIKLLQAGWEIFSRRNKVRGRKGQLVYRSRTFIISHPKKNKDLPIHHFTIEALKKGNFIKSQAPFTHIQKG